jgi:hypothetical protein
MNKRRSIVILLSVVVIMASALGLYFLRNHETPSGQEPLSELNAQTLGAFIDRFNGASSQQRIILLLSPT